ncbi:MULTISPECIES: acyltransferase [unclassified Sulfurospirillum]|uniref:acyltransferase n=1 Tax=unclassified Sulfurospirillum TaxID=2618290 RepID=UPI0005048027|nr:MULTISPECIES: acyltransferase [unclassified Sulfurospirillum]KFL34038.1 galactoside O-acetyltransferase [Sulfurospirillum sp. SCADC]
MIKQILNKLFYNPYRFIKKYQNILLAENTILLKSCTFRFDGKDKQNKVSIGNNTMVGCSFIFESDEGEIEVGNNTFINGGTSLISRSKITIGNNVTIAWGCTLYDHNSHSLDYRERQKDIERQNDDYKNGRNFIYSKDWNVVKSKPIHIENNVWIGFDSVILAGVTVGEGAIVGARSVVRQNVEPWTMVAGNPAVIVKRLRNE